jgi:hypothetical protein
MVPHTKYLKHKHCNHNSKGAIDLEQMHHSSIKQQSVAKKEPQCHQHLIAVHESKKKFVKLRCSVHLQIMAPDKDSPHGHPWATAFLFDGRKLFLMTAIFHI